MNNGIGNGNPAIKLVRGWALQDLKAAPSTHSRKNRLLLAIFSNFTNSGGIKYSLMIA